MRFLIDECLSTKLVDVANREGFEAYHVAHRGWAGLKDATLFAKASAEGLTFVTNDRRDLSRLARNFDLHAGLIVIVPNVRRQRQVNLFRAALDAARKLASIVNVVIEVNESGVARAYALPESE